MATKKQASINAFNAHLNREQREQLPEYIWNFLTNEINLSVNDICNLRPKNIKDYASDFLNAEIGQKLWPLSDTKGWKFDQPQEKTILFVADEMTNEIKRRKKDPNVLIDLVATKKVTQSLKASKKPQQTSRGAFQSSPRASSSRTDNHFVGETSPSRVTTLKVPPNRVAANVDQDDSTRSSPLFFPDTSLRESDNPRSPHEQLTSPQPIVNSHFAISGGRTTNSASNSRAFYDNVRDIGQYALFPRSKDIEKQIQLPTVGQKRPAEHLNEDNLPSRAVHTPPEPPAKRHLTYIDLSSQPASEDNQIALEIIVPVASISINPQEVTARSSTATHDPGASSANEKPLIEALGMQFTTENLAKIPDSILSYLTECQDQNLLSSEATTNEQVQSLFRNRAALFRDMHTDLESRIKILATDSDARKKIVKSYCLWTGGGKSTFF